MAVMAVIAVPDETPERASDDRDAKQLRDIFLV
jgi:hypothetical protein